VLASPADEASVVRRLAIVATLAVAVLLLLPLPAPPPELAPPESDKAVHALLFGGLTVLWAWSERALRGRALAMVAVAVALYGGALELVQALTSYRTADVRDFAADAAGCALAAALVRAFAAVRGRR